VKERLDLIPTFMLLNLNPRAQFFKAGLKKRRVRARFEFRFESLKAFQF